MTTWLTSKQVAERTGKSLITVKRALASGEIHSHQRCKGGKHAISEAVVDAWIQGANQEIACGCKALRPVRRTA